MKEGLTDATGRFTRPTYQMDALFTRPTYRQIVTGGCAVHTSILLNLISLRIQN